jgi:hypothetical protein
MRAVNTDIVESLQSGDFECGDIVSYFVAITVANTTSAGNDAPMTIELDFQFLADSSGPSGVALTEIVLVKINYGTDIGNLNSDEVPVADGGSVATLKSSRLTGPAFVAKSLLLATVQVTDLEKKNRLISALTCSLPVIQQGPSLLVTLTLGFRMLDSLSLKGSLQLMEQSLEVCRPSHSKLRTIIHLQFHS